MSEEQRESFMDFIMRVVEGADDISQAVIILRRNDETVGYKCMNQQFADTLGLVEFCRLSLHHDLAKAWEE